MGSSPAATAPHRDTASYQGSASRMPRCVLPRCHRFSGCGFSQRGWLTCASVPAAPIRAVKPFVSLAADGQSLGQPQQQEQEPSLRPRTDPASAATRTLHTLLHGLCRTHSAACHSLPGTQGPRPTRRPDSAVRRRAAVHAALCTAQAALSSTSIPSGTKTVSAAMACQTPALGYTPARISHSGPAARS